MAYTTTTAIKTYLGISTATDDGLLATLLAAAQRLIDSYTHRTFEASANTTRYFDAAADVYGRELWLDYDLCSIGTVTNGDGSVLGTADYVTEPRRATPYYALTMRSDSTAAWTWTVGGAHENAIAVNGKWAYSATAPDDIAQACIRLVAWMYAQKDNHADTDRAFIAGNTTVLPTAMPTDVIRILDMYKRRGVA